MNSQSSINKIGWSAVRRCSTLALMAGIALSALLTSVQAHNLDTRATSITFDQQFLALMAERAGNNEDLVQVNDEFWVVIKTTPGPGTTTGVGGYQTFYVPPGVLVTDVAYVLPSTSDPRGFIPISMKGQSPIAIGAGPIGAKTAVGLNPGGVGITLGPNILNVSEKTVTDAGLARGTIAGVYADTGIFYSTDPLTEFNSYGAAPSGGSAPMINNSGDTVGEWYAANVGDTNILGVMTLWDSYQVRAFGRKDVDAIIDPLDERGNAPWGMASPVAGPESGYAWSFNYAKYNGSTSSIPACIEVGPWNRIQYPGSQVSFDLAGSASQVIGYAGIDASNLGLAASSLETQQETETINAIRFAIGQLELGRPEFSAIKIKIVEPFSASCYKMYADAFGGDAGGTDNGKDHIWRYFDPTVVKLEPCVLLQKVAVDPHIPPGGTTSFKISFANLGSVDLGPIVLTDTLPSGLKYLSAVPSPSTVSGSTLTWRLGKVHPDEIVNITVYVQATGTGSMINTVKAVDVHTGILATAYDTVDVASYALLREVKTVTPDAVAPGDNVTYTITVYNDGPGPNGVPLVVTDFLPAGFGYVGFKGATLNGAAIIPTINASNTNKPVFTVNQPIQPDKTLVIKFEVNVGPTTPVGTYYNGVELTFEGKKLGPVPEAPVTVGGGKIGDTIFHDWDGDGTQDTGEEGTGEEGMEGVTVELWLDDDNNGSYETYVGSKVTDANGNYLFTGLLPGKYEVRVPSPGSDGVPAGYTLTADPDGGALSTSYQHELLTSDEAFLDADWGYQPGGDGSIGDLVFEDHNGDGLFNGTDAGIDGVTVRLYEDTNGNGVLDSGDLLIDTTTTASGGSYSFDGLAEGLSYLVEVDTSDSDLATHFNPNPYEPTTAVIQPVSSLSGTYDDADFGFMAVQPSSIGDTVFIDQNADGDYDLGTDTPLPYVTVTLYRDSDGDGIPDGPALATAVTDPAGQYLFDGLAPDTYLVVVNTGDADLPGGLGAVVSQYIVSLPANTAHDTADFPFVQFIDKTVDKSYATAGQTLNFSITPYIPGTDPVENVRVFDPLPAGTTYVGGSANAGGTYGAYTPIAAVAGHDDGPPILDTALSTSVNFAQQGGSIEVKLNVKSSVAVNNVSPTVLTVHGGAATVSGPSPASGNVPAGGAGLDFFWTVTLLDAAEYTFQAGAQDDAQTTTWPDAQSASVLSAVGGGPNMVTWSLGSTTAGVPGEVVTSGRRSGVYGFRGANTKEFSRYGIISGGWTDKADPSNGIEKGGALTFDGNDTIYASEGNSKVFYKYVISTDTWSTLANASDNFNKGGGVQYLEVGGVKYVYAVLGNANRFRRYSVSGNSWASLANVPVSVKRGGAITTDGTSLYVLQGDGKTGFYRYNIGANTWTTMTSVPANVGWGGALTYANGYIYAFRGNNTTDFWRYDIAGNSWSAMTSAPGAVNAGGALTTDGNNYIYAFQGATKVFWRYDIAANAWSALTAANFTGNVGQGGALAYVPAIDSHGRTTTICASPMLLSVGDQMRFRMTLTSTEPVANVTPGTPTFTATGGASATHVSGPTLISDNDDIADSNDSVIYEWVYTANPGASPGSLTFSASAWGDAPVTVSKQVTASSDDAEQNLSTGAMSLTSSDLELINDLGVDQKVGMRFTGVSVPQGATVLSAYVEFVNNPSTPPESGATTLIFAAQAADNPITFTTTANNITSRTETTANVTWSMAAGTTWGNDGDKHQTPDLKSVIQEVVNRSGWASGNAMVILVRGSGERSAYAYDTSAANAAKLVIQYATTSFATARSCSVLVSPVLAFQATVNDPAPADLIENTALMAETSGDVGSVVSPTTETATSASIGDRVWTDLDRDGVQDTGELGIAGVRVCVYQDDGVTLVDCDTTDANGNYRISGLDPDDYVVRIDPTTYPTGYFPTTPVSLDVTLTSGQQYVDADYGLAPLPPGTGSIGDFVWLDADNDGVQDVGETGIANVTIILEREINGQWVQIATTVTDANGAYLFDGLSAADYRVTVDTDSQISSPYADGTFKLGDAMDPTYDKDGTGTPDVTLVTLENDSSVVSDADFGYDWSGSIGDYVWWDDNTDGIQDLDEDPIPGAYVMLFVDANNNGILDIADGDYQIAGMPTDSNGLYLFDDLPPGNYLVDVYEDSITTDGNRDTVPTTADVVFVDLGAGEDYDTADFGYYEGARVEGNVFWDANHNGILEPGEMLLEGITVTLTGTDINGTPVSVTVDTDADGHYVFIVPEGDYTVTYDFTDVQSSYPALGEQTTPTSYSFHAYPGEDGNRTSYNFGVDNTGSVGDFVWNDADNDGIQDVGEVGLAGVTVSLYVNVIDGKLDLNGDGSITSADTGTFGGRTITDGVIYAGGNPLNGSLFGVTVINGLLDLDGDPNTADDGLLLVATTITDAQGKYLFVGLEDATYQVMVDSGTLPAGFTQTYDNDMPTTDHTGVATVSGGGADLSADFGYYKAASYDVTGRVWNDADGEGDQDDGEAGIEDVTVSLVTVGIINGYVDLDGDGQITTDDDGTYGGYAVTDGVISAQDDTVINGYKVKGGLLDVDDDGTVTEADDQPSVVWATTTTDASGNYSFLGVPNGDYLVKVDSSTLPSAAYTPTYDPNGIGTPHLTGITVANADVNNQDFGYQEQLASISGTVVEGINGNGLADASEVPIGGVTITLYYAGPDGIFGTTDDVGEDGEPGTGDDPFEPLTTETAADGTYTFTGLVPGNYRVVETDLSGYASLADADHGNPNTIDVQGLAPGQDLENQDFEDVLPDPAIGDYVWLDENGDGIQDAGEAGIPNVIVYLYSAGENDIWGDADDVVRTTVTDANGRYLFKGLLPDTEYHVEVDTDSLPAGLSANQTYDPDATKDHYTVVTTPAIGGEGVFTADFGYNWSSTDDVQNGTGTGAIGDRVWIDADGDGVQDPGEAGLGGVTVELMTAGPDGLFGTADDVVAATTTTAADGSYIFDDLAAGAYVIRINGGSAPDGYSQSGDPDEPGVQGGAGCSACDNQTTAPIILAPGDVYVNADFGYQPTGDSGTVSGTIWFDADADQVGPTGTPGGGDTEPVIAGVTVALIKDLDGDGVWDAGEPIIATTVTDASGDYSFPGLPVTDGDGTDDYLVWVNDTGSVLTDRPPTYDSDGTGTQNVSAATDLSPAGDEEQDFGYTALGQSTGRGLIGDTIFFDADGDGVYDVGEQGLEGVTVELYESDGTTLVDRTTTDENGNYYFGDLDTSLTYVVKVDATTLPNGGSGLVQSVDPDVTLDNSSSRDLSSVGPIDLAADFGYKASSPHTISGTVWKDANADGTLTDGSGGTPDETGNGIGGVTVVLRDSDGDVVATTITDADGSYSFSGLPDGTYTVDVTDDYNILNGYWKSDGPNDGTDNNSQTDPYTVTVAGADNTTADFGYYLDPALVGNYVWHDLDNYGVQESGESGLAGVIVTLVIEYPDGTVTVLTTKTDDDGFYSFGNLLLDESYDGVGTGEPTYTISVNPGQPTLSDYVPTVTDNGADDLDSDNPIGVVAQPVKGGTDDIYDFGFRLPPETLALLESIDLVVVDGNLQVVWKTASEVGTVAFDLYRRLPDGQWALVNSEPVLAENSLTGGSYAVADAAVNPPGPYRYRLVELQSDGSERVVGEFELVVEGQGGGSTPRIVSIQMRSNEAVIRWEGGKAPYRLEMKSDLNRQSVWQPVELSAPDARSATVPMNGKAGFFRVRVGTAE